MRKLLLAGAFALLPLVAFAKNDIPAGDIAASGSLAGVQSTQGTAANSALKGGGLVINGAVAGNYTDMQTAGSAQAGKGKATTNTTASQLNIGGVVTGGYADPKQKNGATGSASAWQNSRALGGSAAIAVEVTKANQGRGHGHGG